MERFICLGCKYKFGATKMPKVCPYCNKDAVEKDKSAEDIVEEIEAMLE